MRPHERSPLYWLVISATRKKNVRCLCRTARITQRSLAIVFSLKAAQRLASMLTRSSKNSSDRFGNATVAPRIKRSVKAFAFFCKYLYSPILRWLAGGTRDYAFGQTGDREQCSVRKAQWLLVSRVTGQILNRTASSPISPPSGDLMNFTPRMGTASLAAAE